MLNYALLLTCNAKAELARREYLDFVLYVKDNYSANWHHILLCDYLQRWIDGDIKRLMVFMPPQHGKSELVSRNLPAYILGRNPSAKVVLASYSTALAQSFNRDCQRIIDSTEYREVFPNTTLTRNNKGTESGTWLRNSDIFETVGAGGFLKSVGLGGALTGTPADYAIIDDPIKDSIEAMSPTYQARNWNWYNDVLFTRIHNDSRILITQTRWDTNDLSGLLLKKMAEGDGDEWTVLSLPAIKVDNGNEEDKRELGEALWPARHGLHKLEQVRKQSLRTFEALYQQDPKPTKTGGEFYKEFTYSKVVKEVAYNPDIPLHLTFDFNVNPYMSCNVWQVEGTKAYQIAEICTKTPQNTTKGVCKEFMRLYPTHTTGMFIYGDPSGAKADTRTEQGHNDYTIIVKELQPYAPKLRVEPSAPSVTMRGQFINSIFEANFAGIEITIDTLCFNTIEDYQYLKEDSDGTKKKQVAKDLSTGINYQRYGHTSDANDYFLCTIFESQYLEYQNKDLAGKFFYAFVEDKHFINEPFEVPDKQLFYLSFDFVQNTLLIGAIVNGKICVVDLLQSSETDVEQATPIEALCFMFKQKYIDTGITTPAYLNITGAVYSRSKSGESITNKTFYDKIIDNLLVGESQILLRKSGLTDALIREFCNSLMHETDFKVYASAGDLARELNKAYVNEGTLNKAKVEYNLKFIDCFSMFVYCILDFENWQNYIKYYAKK